jgi:hypothetical protein
MVLLEQLKRILMEFKPHLSVDSSEPTSGVSGLLWEESQITFHFFHNLIIRQQINPSLNDFENRIKDWLKTREEAIQTSGIAYLSQPGSPINQMCLQIAKCVAMPSVTELKHGEKDDHIEPQLVDIIFKLLRSTDLFTNTFKQSVAKRMVEYASSHNHLQSCAAYGVLTFENMTRALDRLSLNKKNIISKNILWQMRLLKSLSTEDQKRFIDSRFVELYEAIITPERYHEFLSYLSENAKQYYLMRFVTHINPAEASSGHQEIKTPSSLPDFIAILSIWKNQDNLHEIDRNLRLYTQRIFLHHFNSQLGDWIQDHNDLLSLIQGLEHTIGTDWTILSRFFHLINNREQFDRCYKYISGGMDVDIFNIRFNKFISTLEELENLVLSTNMTVKQRRVLFASFGSHDLKCTPDAFDKLRTRECDLPRIKIKLEYYFTYGCKHDNETNILIGQNLSNSLLENTPNSRSELVERIHSAQIEVIPQKESLGFYNKSSPLGMLLTEALRALPVSIAPRWEYQIGQ